jgi:acyl phosphate:glycerol-3-phosphate acyltransferase
LWSALAFALGSIPFGYLLVRWRTGQDIRTLGSGNIGATNVARFIGKGWGAVVLLLDAAKGVAAMMLLRTAGPSEEWVTVPVGLAAFLGHVLTPWLQFRGGKGVATALGVVGCLSPPAAGLGFLAWLFAVAATRISAVGSLAGAVTACVTAAVFGLTTPSLTLILILVIGLTFTHRDNVKRMLNRSENQL